MTARGGWATCQRLSKSSGPRPAAMRRPAGGARVGSGWSGGCQSQLRRVVTMLFIQRLERLCLAALGGPSSVPLTEKKRSPARRSRSLASACAAAGEQPAYRGREQRRQAGVIVRRSKDGRIGEGWRSSAHDAGGAEDRAGEVPPPLRHLTRPQSTTRRQQMNFADACVAAGSGGGGGAPGCRGRAPAAAQSRRRGRAAGRAWVQGG